MFNNSTIIIGLSGGPDSVFLLHTLAALREEKKLTLIAAHLDHEWRQDSANDVLFCKEVAENLSVTFVSKKISELPLSFKANGSKEEIGRKARRYFFEQCAQEYNASAIALAHHADDQQETFFIRLLRGASLTGLTGIKPKDGLYVRPLLHMSKKEILDYLDKNNIRYLTDPSNQSADFLRNRIRNNVIPALRECDDRFDQNFESTHQQLQQTEEFLNSHATEILNSLQENNILPLKELLALHPVILNRILILWLISNKVSFVPSQGLLDEIIRFLKQPGNAKHSFYEKWQIIKINGQISIELFNKLL